MKLTHRLFLLLLSICSINLIHAQSFSPQETKKILTGFEWRLIRSERNGKTEKLADDLVGTKMVFTSKHVYSYIPSSSDNVELIPYSINADKLYIGENVEDARVNIQLKKNGSSYTLYFTNDDYDDVVTYVWEQGGTITGDGMPRRNYSIVPNKASYNSTPTGANEVIQSINEKLREAIGNIRFFKSGGNKVKIDDASFIATEMGVQVMVRLGGTGIKPTTWTYEFMPEEISEINQADLPDESPVGQISITLETESAFVTSFEKSDGLAEKYVDKITINFLKIDKGMYKELEAELEKLRDIYTYRRNERLAMLESFMDVQENFWISGNEASMTYDLDNVYTTGGTIRFNYYLKNISTIGDSKDWYITVVPLKDIEEIILDKGKSKPNTILLRAGKKGFLTYKANKDDVYLPTTPVKEIPLFINVAKEKRLNRIVELLKVHVKELGGKKLSL